MEAVAEKNPLETGLAECLKRLHFQQGKPINSEAVTTHFVEVSEAYFRENDGDISYICDYLDRAFSSIEQLFLDENTYVIFLDSVAARLKEKTSVLRKILENMESEKTERFEEESDERSLLWKVINALTDCLRHIKDKSHTIQLEPAGKIDKQADEITYALSLPERCKRVEECIAALESLASTGKLFFERPYSNDESMKPLTPENVRNLLQYDKIYFHCPDGDKVQSWLNVAVDKIKATQAEKRLMDTIGYVDREEVETNRQQFGAKGANLLAVQKLLPKFIDTEFYSITKNISIPPFRLVDIELYKRWKNHEDITESLREVYDMFKGKPVMIRSSAVNSEDGEKMTGAGIYLSVPLEENATFEDFMKGVFEVYKSCDCEDAKKYRRENEVEEEYMGLVIQERIENPNLKYTNSTRPYCGDTVDVKSEDKGAPLIFDTPKFDYITFLGSATELEVFKFASRVQPDLHRMNHMELNITNMVAACRFLERHYGQPVQIEFAMEIDWGERKTNFHFFQARPLPASMFGKIPVEFPSDMKPIYECPAEGICDEVLDFLSVYDDNRDKKGFVVYDSSWEASLDRERFSRGMPKEGAAMVFSPTSTGRGHIETLALERGVTLLFNDGQLTDTPPMS